VNHTDNPWHKNVCPGCPSHHDSCISSHQNSIITLRALREESLYLAANKFECIQKCWWTGETREPKSCYYLCTWRGLAGHRHEPGKSLYA
jgi:hypothetical protein